jgi:hypothetical protein
MAGYSGTPLPKKLGIKAGSRLSLLNAPSGLLEDLPDDVVVRRDARGRADVVLAFCTERTELERRMERFGKLIFPDGGLWIAWPKRSSGLATTVTDDVVRQVGLPLGLVDNKVCAIDETWTGLRMVWRVERRT